MKKNVTNIKSDQHFLNELEEVINELKETNSHQYFLIKLENIREIAFKRRELEMAQEKYISIQRALDETGEFSRSLIGTKIAELVYYFAFNFKV